MKDRVKKRIAKAALEGALKGIQEELGPQFSIQVLASDSPLLTQVRIAPRHTLADPAGSHWPRYYTIRFSEPS